MKIAIFALGIFIGLTFNRIPHYVNKYADSPLPPYEGPKYRHWTKGVLDAE